MHQAFEYPGSEKPIKAFEIDAHGVDHAQYFQGAGVAFTEFDDCVTGVGDNAQEAYEDAADQLAQAGWNTQRLPSSESALRRRGLLKSDSVSAYLKRSGQADDTCPSCSGTGGIGHCNRCNASGRVAVESDECSELYYYVTIRVR